MSRSSEDSTGPEKPTKPTIEDLEATLAALKERKARLRYGRTDIADFAAAKYYLKETRRPVKLLPHQAGILRIMFSRDPVRDRMLYHEGLYSTIKKSGKTLVGGVVSRWYAETQTTMGEIYCLDRDSKVLLENGRRRLIRDMVLDRDPGPVMTVVDGALCSRPVIGWHQSPLGDRQWIGVRYRRARCMSSNGGHQRVLWLTDDHPVMTPAGWRLAGELETGDEVVTDETRPSEEQEELIAGTMLGDGYLTRRGHSTRASMRLLQGKKQVEWLEVKRRALSGLSFTPTVEAGNNVVSYTPTGGYWTDLHDSWYTPKKIVDREMVSRCFGPRMLAAWFLDDGSTVRTPYTWLVRFATHCFTIDDTEWLAGLLTHHGYPSYVYRTPKGPIVSVRASATRRLLPDIAPFVPPSMRYKLPDGVAPYEPSSWDLDSPSPYVDCVTVEHGKHRGLKTAYCLDVDEGHAFFASGILVHNCVANDLRQAKGREFKSIEESIRLTPGCKHRSDEWHLPGEWLCQKTKMECLSSGSIIEAISVDAAGEAGSAPDLTSWTEAWGIIKEGAEEFWAEMTPILTKPNSFRFVESYAGYNGVSRLLEDHYKLGLSGQQMTNDEFAQRACRERPGETYEEMLLAFDELNGDRHALVPIWSHESAGLLMYWDQGEAARRMPWQRTPAADIHFREQSQTLPNGQYDRFHLNLWSAVEGEFVPMMAWDACKEDLPPLSPKEPIVVAIDAATTGDCFGIVVATRHPDRPQEAAIRACRKWDPKKEGGVVDYAKPEAFIRTLLVGGCAAGHPLKPDKSGPDDRYRVGEEDCPACEAGAALVPHNILMITYDPHQMVDMMQRIRREFAVRCKAFDQGKERLIADQQLYTLIVQRRLAHTGNLELREHVENAGIKLQVSEDSKMRIDKKGKGKVDLVVAASMAVREVLRLMLD